MILRTFGALAICALVGCIMYMIYLVQMEKPVCPRCLCQYIEPSCGDKWRCRVCGYLFRLEGE